MLIKNETIGQNFREKHEEFGKTRTKIGRPAWKNEKFEKNFSSRKKFCNFFAILNFFAVLARQVVLLVLVWVWPKG